MTQTQTTTRTQLAHQLVFIVLALVLAGINANHFHPYSYREDEAWAIHTTITRDTPAEIVAYYANDQHPPLWLLTMDAWVGIGGHMESVTRFLSVLFSLVTLALTYRLGVDLFNRQTALLGVLALGTTNLFMFYGFEARVYPALTMLTLATQLTFLRWLPKPTFRRALLFVAVGIALIYTHFLGVFALVVLYAFYLLFGWRRHGQFLRATGLFAAIALSFLGWLLPFLNALLIVAPGGIDYALESTWRSLWIIFMSSIDNPTMWRRYIVFAGLALPVLAGVILLVRRGDGAQPSNSYLARLLAVSARYWSPRNWRRWFVPFTVIGTIVLLVAVNARVGSLTIRSVVNILPLLMLWVAFGLTLLPRVVTLVIALLLLVSGMTQFHLFERAHGDFRVMMEDIAGARTPQDRFIFDMAGVHNHVPLMYYLTERLPVEDGDRAISMSDVMQVLAPEQRYTQVLAVEPVNIIERASPEVLTDVNAFLTDAPQVWFISYNEGTNLRPLLLRPISEGYRLMNVFRYGRYTVAQYRQLPPPSNTDINMAGVLELYAVTPAADPTNLFRQGITLSACSTLDLDIWWRPTRALDQEFLQTLSLVERDTGGVVAETTNQLARRRVTSMEVNGLYVNDHQLTVPCDAPLGIYQVVVGVHVPEDPNQRLRIAADGTLTDSTLALLMGVQVVE